MGWKTDLRSLYYDGAPEPDDPVIDAGAQTAFLVIDVQNTYLRAAGPRRSGRRAPPLRRLDAVPRSG